jgi:hypothetical protein
MPAHDGVDTRPQPEGDVDIGTQATVGENHIAGEEESEALADPFAFMHAQGTLGPVQQGAASQAEAADEFGDGEAAAFLLVGRLRKSPLMAGGVGHGAAGAGDDFDVSTAPALCATDPPL